VSGSNPNETRDQLDDGVVRQSDLDDRTYENRSGSGVTDDGPSKK